MKIKKALLIIILIVIVLTCIIIAVTTGKKEDISSKRIKVTASNFASYDFLRAIIGKDNDNVELRFLLGPGKDTHSYDPTAQDLIKIQESDLFIYVGGEIEKWSEKVLSTLNTNTTKVICIADNVETIKEQEVDGVEREEEEDGSFDEHVWTSPKNAIAMVNILEKAMEEIDGENASKYKENAENYIARINEIDKNIKEIVDSRKRDRLVFGDKMPMQYFINYYGLKVSAAFNGCSTETDPSSRTVAYLVNKVKEENIPVVLYIELNTGKVAKIIADEVGNGCIPMQIQTLHNISKEDFDNGETYISLMERNFDVLKKALQ